MMIPCEYDELRWTFCSYGCNRMRMSMSKLISIKISLIKAYGGSMYAYMYVSLSSKFQTLTAYSVYE